MMNFSNSKRILKTMRAVKRTGIDLSRSVQVKEEYLRTGVSLPLVFSSLEDIDLIEWASSNQDLIQTRLLEHGGLLFRNFAKITIPEFERFVQSICGTLEAYSYRSTPRTQVSGHIYTSTEYPPDQSIPLHNEMSYTSSWPMKICFFCTQVPAKGGETPLADSRRVYERIAPEVRLQFAQKQVMYVRNYGRDLDLPWQDVFQTDSREEVAVFCHQQNIELEWLEGDTLRTREICQAVATHPVTGEAVWFNQAHLFHISSLPITIRQRLIAEVGEENLPRNTYYGDGTPIEEAILTVIRDAYQHETHSFPWQEGDVLLLDNMLIAHGRAPFSGPRKILVGMAQQYQVKDTH